MLDSCGNEPKGDYCGAIYKVAVPLKNASFPPLTWQTYDITFHAPARDPRTTNKLYIWNSSGLGFELRAFRVEGQRFTTS